MKYLDIEYNEQNHPKTQYPKELAEYLCRRFEIGRGSKILEVGCGRGDFINAFNELRLNTYAIDMEERHPNLKQGVKFRRANLENGRIPVKDGSMDVVFTKSVIEHIVNYDNFMRECRRVLKAKGKIIVMTPDWKTTLYMFYDDFTHIHPYTKASVKNLLLRYDFENVSSEEFCQLPVVWKYPALRIISKAARYLPPPKEICGNKFIRWSRELIILAYGEKI